MASLDKNVLGKKKKLQDMNVDEFFNANSDSESDISASTKSSQSKQPSKSKLRKMSNPSIKSPVCKSTDRKPDNSGKKLSNIATKKSSGIVNGDSAKAENQLLTTKKKKMKAKLTNSKPNKASFDDKSNMKTSLVSALKDNDPEFYDFLKEQDQDLLNNLEDLSDSSYEPSDESANEDNLADSEPQKQKLKKDKRSFEKELLKMSSGESSDSEDDENKSVHQLPRKLEVASDESESDEEEDDKTASTEKRAGVLITHKMIDNWTSSIKKPSFSVFKEIISAFHAAVQEAEGDQSQPSKYKVEGSAIFNSVVRLCLTQIIPALESLLHIPVLAEVKQALSEKTHGWLRLKLQVKLYLSDILKLISNLSEPAMLNVILKHVHKLIVFYVSFGKLTRLLIKRMIKLWTTGEETTRVLAFLCINKIVRLKQEELLEPCLKQMYLAYVSNCKFTSPTTLPVINFMQQSLVEIFNTDQTIAYQYAFIYLRQLAIHLRNAISVKKKETCQTVYNWQFIHCLSLWVKLLCATYPSEVLLPLIYPLTQTIVGTLKLMPTARYYPLRFHCVRLLNNLSKHTHTFIPTVPYVLEVFEQTDFNKKHKNISQKPFNFAVILKFSKVQLVEKAFKDGLIDQLYELLMESFNIHAHSVGFPEFIIPAVVQLKIFLKKCKIANYCKTMKQIVDKIQEHAAFITERRKRSSIVLTDIQSVKQWEAELSDKESPLRKYYASYRKMRDRELQHQVANKESISGAAIDIPTIDRQRLGKAGPKEKEDFSKLFENMSDSEDETRFLLKEERPQKSMSMEEGTDSENDDASDFDFDDDGDGDDSVDEVDDDF